MIKLDDLFAALGKGEKRRFEPTKAPANGATQYFRHGFNGVYDSLTMEHAGLKYDIDPCPTLWRQKPEPIDSLKEKQILFDGPAFHFVDYFPGSSFWVLLSDKFHDLYHALDPDGFVSVPLVVDVVRERRQARYWAVMPARVLDAIDYDATDFSLESECISASEDYYASHLRIRNGCAFRPETTKGAPTFIDYYSWEWVWSAEFVEAAAAEGIRGFYTRLPGVVSHWTMIKSM